MLTLTTSHIVTHHGASIEMIKAMDTKSESATSSPSFILPNELWTQIFQVLLEGRELRWKWRAVSKAWCELLLPQLCSSYHLHQTHIRPTKLCPDEEEARQIMMSDSAPVREIPSTADIVDFTRVLTLDDTVETSWVQTIKSMKRLKTLMFVVPPRTSSVVASSMPCMR